MPSPTFLLVNNYDEVEGQPVISHYDLYRIQGAEETERLGLAEAFAEACSLVEWPERIPPPVMPQAWLEVHIEAVKQAASGETGEGEEQGGWGVGGRSRYEDVMWRRIKLVPRGGGWEERVRSVWDDLRGLEGEGLVLSDAR